MKTLHQAWGVVKEHWHVYLWINLIYYGLVAIGMIYVAFNPELQRTLIKAVGQSFTEGPLKLVGGAYTGGKLLSAMLLTFVINLFVGSFLSITLPSLILPFSGLLLGIYRAALWGLLLSPASPELRLAMIPHSITLILEGQAYILALLAAYQHGVGLFWPGRMGGETFWKRYLVGIKRTGLLYNLVILLLAVAAIYEALEVILLVPLLVPR